MITANHSKSPPSRDSQKNGYSCLPIYSDGGCGQPRETVEEIEIHEQANLQEHSVHQDSVGSNRREDGGQRSS
jgi:hypothetical protein